MVGASPALSQVTEQIRRAAPVRSAVLIRGESGVGKELVARAIHRNSPRARERFVQVNCAALPEDLIESELFGHEKGSFTGATEKQVGKFEQADRGTIFLRRGRRHVAADAGEGAAGPAGRRGRAAGVGADHPGRRARAGGHEQGPRRGDRERRVPRGPVLPPERHSRSACLRSGTATATSRCSCATSRGGSPAENNFRPKRFTDAAVERLARQRWRGNVRELRNSVERLMVMAPGETVDAADVQEVLRVDAPRGGGTAPDAAAYPPRVQGAQRARVPRGPAPRAGLEHLADGGGDRHAA